MAGLRWMLAVFLICFASPAAAQGMDGEPEDKSGYNLMNPTPRALLREMSTDRPDKTESPYTVDAGRFQVEMDFVTYAADTDDDANVRVESVNVAPINLKLGLTNSTDLQVIFDSYVRQTVTDRATGARDRIDGFGDVTVRLKRNLWGNDGGATALALMPFVKLPTNSNRLGNDVVEFGIIVPLAIGVSDRVGIGLMTEVDFLEGADGEGLSPTFVNSATVSVGLADRIGIYTELFAEKGIGGDADWVVTFDAGLTYAVSGDIQLDAGVNLGVTDAADDVNLFIGLSRRF